MLKPLKTYLELGNLFCGIEHALKGNQEILHATVLKKSKNQLDIKHVFKADSPENMVAKLTKNQHVYLIINDEHILTKRIDSGPKEMVKLVYEAFPNINLEDFFYEIVTQEKAHFVSICRKSHVEELVARYKKLKFSIINISLGNLIVSSICRLVNQKNLVTSNSDIVIENDKMVSIDSIETTEAINYDVNGLRVTNDQLLSLSGALDSVLGNFQPKTNLDILKRQLKKDYRQSRFYVQFLKIGLVFILAILLLNFFVFNHYFTEVNTLKQTSQINKSNKENILKLNEHVNKSQKMVDDLLKSSSSKSSFYVNSIIQRLPNTILLSKLNYQPLLKRIKTELPIEINANTILISGESNNSESFSQYINNLETMKWVKNVEVFNYGDISKDVSNFSLKLTMTNDL